VHLCGRAGSPGWAIMILKWLFGILTAGATVAMATNTFEAGAAGVPGSDSMIGMLLLLGLGLVGLGIRGREKIRRGKPKDGGRT
jgi:hypothetical protein